MNKSKLKDQIRYVITNEQYLKPLLRQGKITEEVYNKTLARKQWLFSNSDKGAKVSAVFYSITATACANGLNMERYFTYLFSKLPFNGKITDNLLPWSDKMIEKFHV